MNFKIGLDGGGTKTEFILVDPSGAIVSRRLAPGCNPSLIDQDTIRSLLLDNLHALAAEARTHAAGANITHTLLCMAGNRQFWRELAPRLGEFGIVQTFDDSLPVLELATGGAPGLVLHSGTGSFVAARGLDNAIHYAGGLGWRFGDGGSAHDLGRRAVARTQLELQGWATRSALGTAVCEKLKLSDHGAISRYFYSAATPHTAVADFGPLVTTGVAAGDPVALEVFRTSIGELATLAQTVIAQLFKTADSIPVGLSGTILQLPATRAVLDATLDRRADFRPISEPPVEGVRRMLARL